MHAHPASTSTPKSYNLLYCLAISASIPHNTNFLANKQCFSKLTHRGLHLGVVEFLSAST